MSGHSQFANIKHRKDAQDSKRAQVFAKVIKEIKIAVQKGGVDPNMNAPLRQALEKAKAVNMNKQTYLRLLSKSEQDKTHFQEITYEGYLQHQIAIILSCLTDNKNRTSANVKSYFNKVQGHLAASNSVLYLFDYVGLIQIKRENQTEETIWDLVFLTDANDVQIKDTIVSFFYDPKKLHDAKEKFIANGIHDFLVCQNTYWAKQPLDLPAEQKLSLQKVIAWFEADEDIVDWSVNCSV